MEKAEKKKVVIIGGGPAGLMAASQLAPICDVHIYEQKASAGRKFLVAGEGGFNLSHEGSSDEFAQYYLPTPAQFLPFLQAFDSQSTRVFFHNLGIETYVGSSGKIFPLPEIQPAHVLKHWTRHLKKQGVQFHFKHRWIDFSEQSLRIENPKGLIETHQYDACLFALGGKSWSHTGSDGKWVDRFQEAGIGLSKMEASNVGFHSNLPDDFHEKYAGSVVKNVCLHFQQQQVKGECTITNYGWEGAPIYALSPYIRQALKTDTTATAFLDLKPQWSEEKIVEKLQQASRKKSISDLLYRQIKLAKNTIALLKISCSKENFADPISLAKSIKQLPITLQQIRPIEEAISTAGGIHFDTLQNDLMLKAKPGVFVAGEMLNWEARTGGYLLQGCFSTGYCAAKGIANYLDLAIKDPFA